jgi:hypothetical protein
MQREKLVNGFGEFKNDPMGPGCYFPLKSVHMRGGSVGTWVRGPEKQKGARESPAEENKLHIKMEK